MTTTVELEILGTERIGRSMDALAQHMGKDLRPMFRAVRDWWYTHQSEMFAEEGAPVGGWVALSEKYGKWKAEKHPHRGILELTGRLQRAMTGGRFSSEKITSKWMRLGVTGIPYLLAQNFGATMPNGAKLPARKFLATGKESLSNLDKALQEELADIKRVLLRELGGPGGMAR